MMQQPLRRILDDIRALGLNDNLMELESQGFTTIPNVLICRTFRICCTTTRYSKKS